MSDAALNPARTVAIVLGASEWPFYAGFQSAAAFRNSAEGFRDYLIAPNGLAVPKRNVKFIFDSHNDPLDILDEIINFLGDRVPILQRSSGSDVIDLIVYYVGHGGFANPSSDYFLAMRSTRSSDPYLSSLPIISLSRALNAAGRHLRRYLILDCCFAGAAYKTFQTEGPLGVAAVKVVDAFPRSGTALLCASGARDPAKAPPHLDRTMFTGALLSVLDKGDEFGSARLSLQELGHLVRRRITEDFDVEGVRPEVHTPEQRQGRIDEIPLFPNAAHIRRMLVEAEQLAEEEAQRETEEARRHAEAKAKAQRDAEEAQRHAEAQARSGELHRASFQPNDTRAEGSHAHQEPTSEVKEDLGLFPLTRPSLAGLNKLASFLNYANGAPIPEPIAKLLRLCVRLKLRPKDVR